LLTAQWSRRPAAVNREEPRHRRLAASLLEAAGAGGEDSI